MIPATDIRRDLPTVYRGIFECSVFNVFGKALFFFEPFVFHKKCIQIHRYGIDSFCILCIIYNSYERKNNR